MIYFTNLVGSISRYYEEGSGLNCPKEKLVDQSDTDPTEKHVNFLQNKINE